MPAIDRLSKAQRDELMGVNIDVLIRTTVKALDDPNNYKLAAQWDKLRSTLVHVVTHAREDIFESRKRVAVIRDAFTRKNK